MNGQKEVVVYLISKEADVFIKNNAGKVAAQEAYEKNFYEISEILVDREILLRKDDIIQTNVDKNDPEDQIDLDNVDVDNLDKVQENFDKLNVKK